MNIAALKKLERYCAYQERCQREVRKKLLQLKIYGHELEEIISELIANGFLDESRFAQAFVRGKFRNNRWGRIKIRQQLQLRNIATYDIERALEQLDEVTYRDQLHALLTSKFIFMRAPDEWTRANKLVRYAQQKGYELPLILQALETLEGQGMLDEQ